MLSYIYDSDTYKAEKLRQELAVQMAGNFSQMKRAFIPLPIYILSFIGIRALLDMPIPSLHEGGIGFFTDITQPDPYWRLPFLSATASLLALRVR
jgi:hypothetical protein